MLRHNKHKCMMLQLRCVLFVCILGRLVLANPFSDEPMPFAYQRQLGNSTSTDVAEVEARLTGSSGTIDGTTYPWLVAVYNNAGSSLLGPGVVVHSSWLVCGTDVVKDHLTTPSNLIMYAGLSNPSTPSGRKYRVKQLQEHASRATIKNAITLVKFCPNFLSTVFSVPSTRPAQTLGNAVKYVNYAPAIQQVDRMMGLTCQCDHYVNYDSTQHFCLDEEATNYIVLANDLPGTICIQGGNFIGINVAEQNKGGEPYLDVATFQSWISGIVSA